MRKLSYRTVKWKLSLPETLAAQVELELSNISGTGPAYGKRSELMADLLQQWLNDIRASKSGAATEER